MNQKTLVERLLPAEWSAEYDKTLGTILVADGRRGYVTVDERRRGFELGMATVRVCGDYAGRNWKANLYLDAIAALNAAIS